MQKDLLLDQYTKASVSDINLESPNCAGDIAIRGFVLDSLYDDFVFADYIDIDNGYIKHESGLVTVDTSASKTWRKARVIMVGPACRNTQPGDIILFPNDKGLPCGEVDYLTQISEVGETTKYDVVKIAKNGIFLSEHRIFAKLLKS